MVEDSSPSERVNEATKMSVNEPSNTTKKQPEVGKSWRHLLRYAVPYTLAYVFLPAVFKQMPIPLNGFLLSALVVVALNLLLIAVFKKVENRGLNKPECGRVGLLVATLTFIVTSILMVVSIENISSGEVTLQTLIDNGMIPILVISGAIGFAINFVVVNYGIWWLQKLWRAK